MLFSKITNLLVIRCNSGKLGKTSTVGSRQHIFLDFLARKSNSINWPGSKYSDFLSDSFPPQLVFGPTNFYLFQDVQNVREIFCLLSGKFSHASNQKWTNERTAKISRRRQNGRSCFEKSFSPFFEIKHIWLIRQPAVMCQLLARPNWKKVTASPEVRF